MKLTKPRFGLAGLQSQAGGALVEAVFAGALIVLFLGGIFEMNWKSIALLKNSKQQSAACLTLQEREEQLRNLTFANITNATYLSTNIFNSNPSAAGIISSGTETLKIDSYPTTSGTAINITRPYGGSATVNSSNPLLSGTNMVRVDFTFSWTGNGNISHTRQFTTLIANGGITQ